MLVAWWMNEWMNEHPRRPRIKYLTFLSKVCGLSCSQNIGKSGRVPPPSLHPTPWAGKVQRSLWIVWKFSGVRTVLCPHHLPQPPYLCINLPAPTTYYESDSGFATCQLCDCRQVIFGFWDLVSSSVNEGLDLNKDGRPWCLQGSGEYWEWVMQIFCVRQ